MAPQAKATTGGVNRVGAAAVAAPLAPRRAVAAAPLAAASLPWAVLPGPAAVTAGAVAVPATVVGGIGLPPLRMKARPLASRGRSPVATGAGALGLALERLVAAAGVLAVGVGLAAAGEAVGRAAAVAVANPLLGASEGARARSAALP